MKIAFVGNQGNNAYRLAKWLRQDGHDCHLFMMKHDPVVRSRPEFIDPDVGTPDWIEQFDDDGFLWLLGRPHARACRINREYDVVVTSGVYGLLALPQFGGMPRVHLSLGGEVTDLPLWRYRIRSSARRRAAAFLAHRALKQADAIITSYSRTVQTLSNLGLTGKTRLWGFPEDNARQPERVNRDLLRTLDAQYGRFQNVFLWLSRLNFSDPTSDEYKGAERFLIAYAAFVRRKSPNVHAIVGRHGHDVDAFEDLVKQWGLDSWITFVPHMPAKDLLAYFNMQNATLFDLLDIEKGTLGGVVREALSIGTPVTMALDRESMEQFYGPECPVLSAETAQECYERMVEISDASDEQRQQRQQAIRDWSTRYLDQRVALKRFLRILGEVTYCSRIDQKIQRWAGRDRAAELEIPSADVSFRPAA